MGANDLISTIKVIDSDSHVTEPSDLWTTRVPGKMRDKVPVVDRHPSGHSRWRIVDQWLLPPGHYARAGWPEYPPSAPRELEEVDPGSWRAKDRLLRMDQYGIHAQVLYPNIIGFESALFARMDKEVSFACVRAYNDFLVEFASEDAQRFIPIAAVPFWDIEESVQEIIRAREAGHKGVLFANRLEQIGFPGFTDPHWDPIYAVAQDLGMSINFHIGFSTYAEGVASVLQKSKLSGQFGPDKESPNNNPFEEHFDATRSARIAVGGLMEAADPLVRLLTEGLCERFPKLPFVSVESGFGYVPYLVEALDWHWKGYGAHRNHPLLPSEIFRRQCYGSFWFETGTLRLLDSYPDNFMFETDYPHPTGMSPGPASPAEIPSVHIARHFGQLPLDVVRKVLHDNAAALYHL